MSQKHSTRHFQSINPATGELVAEFPFLSDDEALGKIEHSRNAFLSYNANSDLAARKEKVLKLASLIEKNAERISKIITEEIGRPLSQSIDEMKQSASLARYYAENCEKYLQPSVVSLDGKKSRIEYHPLGVIYHIVAFNYPLFLSFVGTIPCLLIGNTVMYRPAHNAPRTGKIIEEFMIEAGFNNGEFQTVFTSSKQAELVLANKYVRGVVFMGSAKGGIVIGSIAAKYVKKVTMEFGANDPFLILDDADIEKAVETALAATLNNCGQRFIIDDKVYDKFRDLLLEKITEYKPTNPITPESKLGPLARPELRDSIKRQIKEAQKEGAKLLYGGKRPKDPEFHKGNFFIPAVLEVETSNNILFKEETFGPVFALLRVNGEEEMVRIANDSEYGYGCAIMSENIERARKLGSKIDAGNVALNPEFRLPFRGGKESGFRCQYADFGMHKFVNVKAISIAQPKL